MATHANIDRKEDTQMTKETQQADGLTSHLTQELDTEKSPFDRGWHVGVNQLAKSLCQEKNELDLKAWNYGYKCGEGYYLMKKYPLADAKDHFFFVEKISNTEIKRHTEILLENDMIKEISGVWHYRCFINSHTWFTPADCLLDAVAFVWDVFRIEKIKENLKQQANSKRFYLPVEQLAMSI